MWIFQTLSQFMSNSLLSQKRLSWLYSKAKLYLALGMHGCLGLTCLPALVSPHLFPPMFYFGPGRQTVASAEHWRISPSLLWPTVSSVWNSTGPTHCPEESTHFSRPSFKFHLLLEPFIDPWARYMSSSLLLSWYFASTCVRACITVCVFILFYKLVFSVSC